MRSSTSEISDQHTQRKQSKFGSTENGLEGMYEPKNHLISVVCWQRYTSKHGSKRYRIPLNFGKYTSIQPIPNDDFPEHYFNFIAYNEVQSKADIILDVSTASAILLEPVTQPESRVTRRIIEIQNLDSLNFPFVIFNDMAEKFDMDAYAEMPKPVVIAVTSRWVTTRYGGLQITSTLATYYYLNPNIPEVHHILSVYADFINPTDALEIQSQPRRTDEEERMRNRYSIESLLSVNPQHYQRVKFTTEATIVEINAPNGWYCFKAVINDGINMATITCFSPEAHTFVPDCNEVVNAAANKDTSDVPNALKQVENTTYRYYFRVVIDDGSATTTITCVSPEAHSFVPECNAVIQGNKNEPSPSTKGTEEALQAMAEERKKKVKHQLFPDFVTCKNKKVQ
ncbi:DNA helicase [Tanacetum coccineum]